MSTTRPPWDGLIVGPSLATLDGEGYGAIGDGALGWKDGRIAFVGPAAALPADPGELADEILEDETRHVDRALKPRAGSPPA